MLGESFERRAGLPQRQLRKPRLQRFMYNLPCRLCRRYEGETSGDVSA